MSYAPGSFSKNFAWHGTGLRKLHTAINDGFSGTLTRVDREQFRADTGLDNSLNLIPVNFFLHNKGGRMSVDELVYQALERRHSARFDRLGLFALHLNRVGSGRRVEPRPAMWANEFVREKLWKKGTWVSSALPDAPLDAFIQDRMNAQQDVRVKCRNNYRHLFELCEFWPTPLQTINTQAEQWIASALFLAWDRHILDGGANDKATLIKVIEDDELHKLLGVTKEYALDQSDSLVDLYISVGRLKRFLEAKKAPAPARAPAAAPPLKLGLPEEEGLEWLDQEESDDVVERAIRTQLVQKRNRKIAAALKQHYDNSCQFCGSRLQVSEDRFYSEAAHIRGLGKPNDGPDKVSNLLVLCPNHHLQFDRGILRLQKVGKNYLIRSKAPGDPLDGKAITVKHVLDDECVKHHFDWFIAKRT
ncbi:HNH endonuclease [Paracoccus yeei]|uniref:HNH endonuclease n=2 Tax=Paracoccus yeei TaxID=147645 RepID=UPI0028D90FE3|nr:HNH endonuclease [Paracoccus yeei]